MSAIATLVSTLNAAATPEDRQSAAQALAGVSADNAKEMISVVEEFKKASKNQREAVFMAVSALAGSALAPALEAQLVTLFHFILVEGCGKKASKTEAEAAEAAVMAIADHLSCYNVKFAMPELFKACNKNEFWRTRQLALQTIGHLTEKYPTAIADCIEIVLHELELHIHDLRAQVKDAARKTMDMCMSVVGNPDIENVLGDLASAMADPKQVVPVINKLSGTTFVRSVTTPTLVVLVPLLLRGLSEGQTSVKRQSARIIANMSRLVDEPLDAAPFLPKLLPAIRKAADSVSCPEARDVCAETQVVLEKLEAACAAAKPQNVLANDEIVDIFETCKVEMPEEYKNYLACMISTMIRHKIVDHSEWEAAMLPRMAPFAGAEACKTLHEECTKQLTMHDLEDHEENDDAEELCNCQFTLAYGTKILLHNTEMKLKRGYRYGLLGANDSGKTSLMKAIAEGRVEGFPDASQVKTVYVEADIQGELSHLSCVEYILNDERLVAAGLDVESVSESLLSVGFTQKMLNDGVTTLSGGWRMKLALARAMLQKADILLLDEPTNHLDVINVQWVKDYLLGLTNVTSIIVSHDSGLLNDVCTHILQIDNFRLHLYRGNLNEFVKKVPAASAYFQLKSATGKKFKFPPPGRIEGIKKRGRALMKMDDVTFTYPRNDKPTVFNITVQVSMASRVACVGVNGAGKSTIIKLLTGELIPAVGSVWSHPNARIAYVAQHAFHHIEKHLEKTPNQYIQWRYANGDDKETLQKVTMALTPEEEEKCFKPFEFLLKDEESGKVTKHMRVIDRLTGTRKQAKDKSFEYEVKFLNMDITANAFLPLSKLKTLGFGKHVAAVDAKIAANSGRIVRPLTSQNVEDHLDGVGLEPELATHTPMGALSGGQKVKVVLAAAMWNQPHILILDEPTNYLDRESLGMLAGAIEEWEGGVVMITHNNEFCQKLCPETWVLEKGHLDCKGDPEWMTNAANAAVDEQEQPEEIVDGAGNTIKVGKAKKELSKKEKRNKMKAIKAKLESGEDLTESDDEFYNKEMGL